MPGRAVPAASSAIGSPASARLFSPPQQELYGSRKDHGRAGQGKKETEHQHGGHEASGSLRVVGARRGLQPPRAPSLPPEDGSIRLRR